MTEMFKKVTKLDLSQWVVTKFYRYTSRVTDVEKEYDEMWHQKTTGDKYIKELYEHFLEVANTYLSLHTGHVSSNLKDNKTVIEITNIKTRETLYIGMYDSRYYLGKGVWSEFGSYESFGIIRK